MCLNYCWDFSLSVRELRSREKRLNLCGGFSGGLVTRIMILGIFLSLARSWPQFSSSIGCLQMCSGCFWRWRGKESP
uniref:Pentatricopeptide repeat-containing protein At5g15280 isoform X3 n=1 Tax=Rhizophora mucronata TaxID=61149 RepID=A0A2P2IRI4_RHIMU